MTINKLQTSNFKLQRVVVLGLFLMRLPVVADETNLASRLRPPKSEIPPGYWEQNSGWAIAGGVVVVGIAAVIWFLLRTKPATPIPAVVKARQELEVLGKEGEDGQVLSRVSQVLREYLVASFGLPQEQVTTTEFCRVLVSNEKVGAALAETISNFLKHCDERKFAPTLVSGQAGQERELFAQGALKLVEESEGRLRRVLTAEEKK